MSEWDQAEQLARIERSIAETRKFAAEQQKLSEEALKFRRDHTLAPLVLLAGLIGGILASVAGKLIH